MASRNPDHSSSTIKLEVNNEFENNSDQDPNAYCSAALLDTILNNTNNNKSKNKQTNNPNPIMTNNPLFNASFLNTFNTNGNGEQSSGQSNNGGLPSYEMASGSSNSQNIASNGNNGMNSGANATGNEHHVSSNMNQPMSQQQQHQQQVPQNNSMMTQNSSNNTNSNQSQMSTDTGQLTNRTYKKYKAIAQEFDDFLEKPSTSENHLGETWNQTFINAISLIKESKINMNQNDHNRAQNVLRSVITAYMGTLKTPDGRHYGASSYLVRRSAIRWHIDRKYNYEMGCTKGWTNLFKRENYVSLEETRETENYYDASGASYSDLLPASYKQSNSNQAPPSLLAASQASAVPILPVSSLCSSVHTPSLTSQNSSIAMSANHTNSKNQQNSLSPNLNLIYSSNSMVKQQIPSPQQPISSSISGYTPSLSLPTVTAENIFSAVSASKSSISPPNFLTQTAQTPDKVEPIKIGSLLNKINSQFSTSLSEAPITTIACLPDKDLHLLYLTWYSNQDEDANAYNNPVLMISYIYFQFLCNFGIDDFEMEDLKLGHFQRGEEYLKYVKEGEEADDGSDDLTSVTIPKITNPTCLKIYDKYLRMRHQALPNASFSNSFFFQPMNSSYNNKNELIEIADNERWFTCYSFKKDDFKDLLKEIFKYAKVGQDMLAENVMVTASSLESIGDIYSYILFKDVTVNSSSSSSLPVKKSEIQQSNNSISLSKPKPDQKSVIINSQKRPLNDFVPRRSKRLKNDTNHTDYSDFNDYLDPILNGQLAFSDSSSDGEKGKLNENGHISPNKNQNPHASTLPLSASTCKQPLENVNSKDKSSSSELSSSNTNSTNTSKDKDTSCLPNCQSPIQGTGNNPKNPDNVQEDKNNSDNTSSSSNNNNQILSALKQNESLLKTVNETQTKILSTHHEILKNCVNFDKRLSHLEKNVPRLKARKKRRAIVKSGRVVINWCKVENRYGRGRKKGGRRKEVGKIVGET